MMLDLIFIGLYVGAILGLYYLGRIPPGVGAFEFILLGFAAARLADIISTDEVMTWLREPFVETERTQIAGREVETRTGRGRGLRKVLGDLIACPWCIGVWVAALLTYLYFLFPQVVWLFVVIMAIAELGALLQTASTILVRVEKYFQSLGIQEEDS